MPNPPDLSACLPTLPNYLQFCKLLLRLLLLVFTSPGNLIEVSWGGGEEQGNVRGWWFCRGVGRIMAAVPPGQVAILASWPPPNQTNNPSSELTPPAGLASALFTGRQAWTTPLEQVRQNPSGRNEFSISFVGVFLCSLHLGSS